MCHIDMAIKESKKIKESRQMQKFHSQITQLALDLTLGISNQDRFDRLLYP